MDNQNLHLYTKPKYLIGGEWFDDFTNAVKNRSSLTLDETAIMEILSLNWPCADRTIFKEIRRQPWLSTIDFSGNYELSAIPPHGRFWANSSIIAEKLKILLVEEIFKVCENKKQIFVLLSGGLDSRVLAGILSLLYKSGKLPSKPVCVTWGISECRDVDYANATAKILGFDWEHIELNSEHLFENLIKGAPIIGCLTSPLHLHRALWFKDFDKNSIVLAASWGDSIGRAEFSGRHLLELTEPIVFNVFHLLNRNILSSALTGVRADFNFLRERSPNIANYALREHEMQAFYMRGMIGQALSLIDNYADLYQMFTAPEIYSFMWSLHPSRRDNSIYAVLLEDLSYDLARLPWARTNRSLRDRTIGAKDNLNKDFHHYHQWISGPLYERILALVDPDWFAKTGIFNYESIKKLNQSLSPKGNKCGDYRNQAFNVWTWLAGLKNLCDSLDIKLKKAGVDYNESSTVSILTKSPTKLRIGLSNIKFLYRMVVAIRRFILKIVNIFKYPPKKLKVKM